MKKTIFFLLIMIQSSVLFSQSKQETYDYISDKLLAYALNDADINHKYSIKEFKPYILIKDKCNLHPDVYYAFRPQDFNFISVKNNASNKWLIINCKNNSVGLLEFSSGKFEKYGETSSAEFILDKDTPKEEIERLKKSLMHLFKLYGVVKKDLFDKK